jgi:hypothetical protein
MDDSVESRLINIEIAIRRQDKVLDEQSNMHRIQNNKLVTLEDNQNAIFEVVTNIQTIIKAGSFLVSFLKTVATGLVAISTVWICFQAIRNGDWKSIVELTKYG